jgi:transcriptional regulator with XRE-family HTH domain
VSTKASLTTFAARLNEVCDDMKLPLHGRQTLLAKKFGVTQGATKKWLTGEGYPTMDKLIAICEWSDVNINWLTMGRGPKREGAVDTKSLVLGEAIEAMQTEDRQQVLDFIGYKFERSTVPLFAGERMARYMKMLDAFKKDREAKG